MPNPLSSFEPVPASHPDHLWVAAALRGLDPVPLQSASVLELACGDGSNLIPMAYHQPAARFVGLEGSSAVDAARAAAAQLGLDNVTFVRGDLDSVRRRGERYDYIVVHGVLSTIPDAARAEVLGLSAAVLSEHGVIYVDHIGRAGRLLESRLRELVRRRVGPLSTVAARVRAIRSILDALDQEELDPGNPHTVHARVEVTFAKRLDDAALITHFLAPFRRGLSPSELAALSSDHGLRVFDAGWDPALDRLPERRMRERLAGLVGSDADDFVELMTGRRTHAALLCTTAALAGAGEPAAFVEHGTFAAKLETRLPDVLLSPGIEVAFSTRSGAMVRTKDPFNKVLLTALRDAWPAGLSFVELLEQASARLAEGLPAHPAPSPEDTARQARELLELHRLGAITWRSRDVAAAASTPERPRVLPLTAWQASRSHLLTDAQHRLVVVDELTRRMIALLDGTRDASMITSDVQAWREAGELVPAAAHAQESSDGEGVAKLVQEVLDGLTKGQILRA